MTIELTLETTSASGLLLPARFTQAFTQLAKSSPLAPRGAMHGQEMWLALALAPEDPATPAFLLDFIGQGRRVKGSARGPSAALLRWAFHALADAMKCTLLDEDEAPITPRPQAHRDAAVAYLTAQEAEVHATRRAPPEDVAGALLRWLAREEHVALGDDEAAIDALAAKLPLDAPPTFYELLLESDAVDDVFFSERELTSLVGRFRAHTMSRA